MRIVDEFLKEHPLGSMNDFAQWLQEHDTSFIAHIQRHIGPDETVVCKICGRAAIDCQEAYDES